MPISFRDDLVEFLGYQLKSFQVEIISMLSATFQTKRKVL